MDDIKDLYINLNQDVGGAYKKLTSSKVGFLVKMPIKRSELASFTQRLLDIDLKYSATMNISGAFIDNKALVPKLQIVSLSRTLAIDTISKLEHSLSGLESKYSFLVSVMLSLFAIVVSILIATFS